MPVAGRMDDRRGGGRAHDLPPKVARSFQVRCRRRESTSPDRSGSTISLWPVFVYVVIDRRRGRLRHSLATGLCLRSAGRPIPCLPPAPGEPQRQERYAASRRRKASFASTADGADSSAAWPAARPAPRDLLASVRLPPGIVSRPSSSVCLLAIVRYPMLTSGAGPPSRRPC